MLFVSLLDFIYKAGIESMGFAGVCGFADIPSL